MISRVAKLVLIASSSLVAFSACTRIETGSVGVRVDMSKEIQGNELVPGSWNQTVVGDVITFPVKDIAIDIANKTPMTSENTALADFDMTIVYSVNPSAVAELYSTKSKAFHAYDVKSADTFLMYNYMTALVNNASYKVIRNYTNLQAADNRQKIEQEIRDVVTEQLKDEKLENSLSLMVVQVRNILPNAAILDSATNLVRSQNELKVKENEVAIAQAEARRMQALAQNSGQSIAYMNAQATMMIAEGIRNGKVGTIIIPHNMTALGSFK